MRSTRLNPMSKKRRASLAERERVRLAVFERDGGCVARSWVGRLPEVPPCSGPMTPHHLLKASQGGPYSEANLVCLCSGHNVWVEDFPDDAYHIGLVIRRGDPLPWEAA